MTDLTTIVTALASIISAGYGVVQGNLTALLNLLSPIMQLKAVDFSALKSDLAALTAADRATLESQFDASLSISNATLAAQIAGGADALNNAVTIAEALVAQYAQIEALVTQVKGIFTTNSPVLQKASEVELTGNPGAAVTIPGVPSWLMSVVTTVLVNFVLPELATLIPSASSVITEIETFISGGIVVADDSAKQGKA